MLLYYHRTQWRRQGFWGLGANVIFVAPLGWNHTLLAPPPSDARGQSPSWTPHAATDRTAWRTQAGFAFLQRNSADVILRHLFDKGAVDCFHRLQPIACSRRRPTHEPQKHVWMFPMFRLQGCRSSRRLAGRVYRRADSLTAVYRLRLSGWLTTAG